ncbi:MAG: Spore coat protein CotJA [Firmicutes bacterium]|nr:Spore coat protein CotJA [Bacillota bacterium]
MKKELYKTSKQMWMPTEDEAGMGMMLAHSYVPWQYYDKAFGPQEALMKGTLFPELYGVYMIPQ